AAHGSSSLLVLQLAVDGRYTLPDHAPVVFQLLLTGSPRGDPAAPEAAQLRVLALDARQSVLKIGQLHLQAARRVPRVRLEDADDQFRPVHDRYPAGLLQ